MKFHSECLVCKSKKLKDLVTYKDAYLTKCSECSFVFSRKIPSSEELELHYEGYSRNDYLSPITIKRYNELLDFFEKFRNTGKLLDVGCGIGYFLEEAKKRGWEVYGTEYTDAALEICENKGIITNKGELDPKNYLYESFDIITSFEVIEHINNPKEEIANFYNILRKGGLVYITTPNWNSLLRFRLKSAYNVISYPEHLSYYTRRTLSRLFTKSGFKKVRVETTGISLTRLRTSRGSSNQEFISRDSDDEILRNNFEKNIFLRITKKVVNSFLTVFGVGDSLKGWYIKL